MLSDRDLADVTGGALNPYLELKGQKAGPVEGTNTQTGRE
jgi:hypothetical protein